MNADVYILGAGASVESGAPLMFNFLDVAEDLLRQGAFKEDSDKIELVFELINELQIVHSKAQLDINNIESLFGAIEMGRILGRLTNKEQDVSKYREALVTLISKTIEKSMLFPLIQKTNRIQYVSTFKSSDSYNLFAEVLKHKKSEGSSVLTFNYDLGLELGLNFNDVNINYCLDEETTGFKVLKLHGSINWYRNTIGEIKYLSFPDMEKMIDKERQELRLDFQTRYNLNISSFLKNQLSSKGSPDIDAVIVPPTWNKTEYHGQLTKVWESAADELSNAKNIYILGYSLPESDSFFRYLFALGTISKSRIRNIIIYNKDDSGQTEARFKRLLGLSTESRFQYRPLKFSEAIIEIAKEKGINLSNNKSSSW